MKVRHIERFAGPFAFGPKPVTGKLVTIWQGPSRGGKEIE